MTAFIMIKIEQFSSNAMNGWDCGRYTNVRIEQRPDESIGARAPLPASIEGLTN